MNYTFKEQLLYSFLSKNMARYTDLADKKGKDEDAHKPAGRHEAVLHLVLGPGVLTDRRGSFRGEVETPDVPAPNPNWI